MAKQEILCGLDIGSGQVTCVLGRINSNSSAVEIVSAGQDICRGVKGGVVVDINATADSIRNAIEEAESKIDDVVNDIYLGIRGIHVETHNSRGVISISRTDKEITADDVNSVIENAKAIQISADREIIDILVQEFSLDRQRGVHNPIGMEGNFLEVYALLVTASVTHLNNTYKAIAKAGFSTSEVIYGLLATADAVVTEEEKESGCLLVDMGGQCVSLAVFSEKSIRYTKELPFGCDFITKDISYALRTSFGVAKNIKEKYGVASPSQLKDDQDVEYLSVDGRTKKNTSRRYLAEIISPRVEEILEKINNEVQNTSFMDAIIPGGVIITGGGAMLEGMKEACEKIFGIETRIGLSLEVNGPNSIISNPAFVTAISALKYRPRMGTRPKKQAKSGRGSIISLLRDWI